MLLFHLYIQIEYVFECLLIISGNLLNICFSKKKQHFLWNYALIILSTYVRILYTTNFLSVTIEYANLWSLNKVHLFVDTIFFLPTFQDVSARHNSRSVVLSLYRKTKTSYFLIQIALRWRMEKTLLVYTPNFIDF